jgi:hypothetical protein
MVTRILPNVRAAIDAGLIHARMGEPAGWKQALICTGGRAR